MVTMKKKLPLTIAVAAAAAVLAIVSFVLLPDTVITQLSFGGSAATTMPKLVAIGLPTLFSVGGAAAYLAGQNDNKKSLLVSGVGILIFVIMLIVNL